MGGGGGRKKKTKRGGRVGLYPLTLGTIRKRGKSDAPLREKREKGKEVEKKREGSIWL